KYNRPRASSTPWPDRYTTTRSSTPRPARNIPISRRISCSGRSSTDVTVNPPIPGSASTSTIADASCVGARNWVNPASSYVGVATTGASRAPGSSGAACSGSPRGVRRAEPELASGCMPGHPGVDNRLLLLRCGAGELDRVAVDGDLDGAAVAGHPVADPGQ